MENTKQCVCIGWPTIALLAHGQTVIVDGVALIPDDLLSNSARKIQNGEYLPCKCTEPREVKCEMHKCGTCSQIINANEVMDHSPSIKKDTTQDLEHKLKEAKTALDKALEEIGPKSFQFVSEEPKLSRPLPAKWPELKPKTFGMAREIDTGNEPNAENISKMAAEFVVSLFGIKPKNADENAESFVDPKGLDKALGINDSNRTEKTHLGKSL